MRVNNGTKLGHQIFRVAFFLSGRHRLPRHRELSKVDFEMIDDAFKTLLQSKSSRSSS